MYCALKKIKNRHLKGFTLIELLVVIAIISVLMSILVPAMSKARYQARRIVCMTNMKTQAFALFLYATENKGKFPPNNSNGPQYMRSNAVGGCDVFSAMYGTYIDRSDVVYCPLLESSNIGMPRRYYSSGGYGGWDILEWSGISINGQDWDPTSGPSTYVVSDYCWYANFRSHVPDTYKVTFEPGEPAWPRNQAECNGGSAIISHEVSSPDYYTIYWDVSHGGNPDLYGASIEEMESFDNPVAYSDGSVIFRLKTEMKARADAPWGGGSYYYFY